MFIGVLSVSNFICKFSISNRKVCISSFVGLSAGKTSFNTLHNTVAHTKSPSLLNSTMQEYFQGWNQKKKVFREKNRSLFPMLFAKRKYNSNMIIDKCLEFYDLKSNKRYIFFMNFNIKLQFSLQQCKFKVIYTFTKSVYAIYFYNFHVNYIMTQFKTSQNILHNYLPSSINLVH